MSTSEKLGAVVVGVDGSIPSDAALEWAVHYSQARHRPLRIVNGAGDPRSSEKYLGAEEARSMLLLGGRMLTDAAMATVHRLAPDLVADAQAPLVDARSALLDASATASLVVVGTRGRGPVAALLLGSVSTAVTEHAACPVAVVRERDAGPDPRQDPVVVGVDNGPSSTAALELAFELASFEGRPLAVVHSWIQDDSSVEWLDYQQRLKVVRQHELELGESLAGYAEKFPDVRVVRQVSELGPVQSLVNLSATAAVVVVGSRGRTGARSVFGSVSRDVQERAHCTVVVVRS